MRRLTVRSRVCVIALFALILSGCSAGEVINESNAAQSFAMTCERFSDTRETGITVGESASAALSAAITHKSGSLSVLISNELGEVIYSGSDIASATSFTLVLVGPAEYTIQISADRFSGSWDFQWETVGGSISEVSEAEPAPSPDPLPAAGGAVQEPPASDALSDDVTITSTPVEPESEPDAAPAADAEPEPFAPVWNGRYENADTGVAVEFFWVDSNFVEFQISGVGSVVTATAQIDEAAPDSAHYTYGDELELSFRLTPTGLIVTQTGTSSLLPSSIAGEFLPAQEQPEP